MIANNIPLTAIIITLNESVNLKKCLDSLYFCNQIVVVDSFSTDNTCDIATSCNATVVKKKFINYCEQRNYSIHHSSIINDYVLILDADEIISSDLRINIVNLFSTPPNFDAYEISRLDFLDGKPLRYTQISKKYIRIFNRKLSEYHRDINESLIVNGTIGSIPGLIHHYPFSKGLHHWFEKHNTYSTMEASYIYSKYSLKDFLLLFNRNEVHRRPSQKKLFNILPFKIFIKFTYMFFFRLGFLDGRAGFKYTVLQCIYEYMIILKRNEKNIIN